MPSQPLWTPEAARREQTNLVRFMAALSADGHGPLATFEDLHAFSLAEPARFWDAVWDFCGVIGDKGSKRVIVDGDKIPGARFFPDARLCFAENLLAGEGPGPAMIFRAEDRREDVITREQLRQAVSRTRQALVADGLRPGDRVAAVMPNCPETVIAFLAANSLGAVWSSCSPDFGEEGIIDRFGQIEPKMLIACDGYWYGGKTFAIADKIAAVARRIPSLEHIVIVDFVGNGEQAASGVDGAVEFGRWIEPYAAGDIDFHRAGFDAPVYILFSSGTTGKPKCIVHRAGGVLLKHLSEQVLHCDIKPGERLFYFTTCGWMMWNWLVSGLAAGATLLLYDGSPFHPDEKALFDYADDHAMTVLGTSAKFIDAVKKTGWRPAASHDLKSVRTILSTGSPLAAESFDFVYEGIKRDVHLASISGGTDLCGCFVVGNPLGAVWRGEIQAPALGLDIAVFDDDGKAISAGKGELVCRNAFPSMPLGFWNDAEGKRYHDAYFARFPGVWCHGDFAEWGAHGGMIIHGRSDATLNPGGVRIGTAEIYAQVEQMAAINEALAIGQEWDGDVRIVLFVRLAEGFSLDEELERDIRRRIRAGASPRHVPAKIVAVADIPRTKSGKITELAVRDVVHGREVKNIEALANPEALELYRDLPALRS